MSFERRMLTQQDVASCLLNDARQENLSQSCRRFMWIVSLKGAVVSVKCKTVVRLVFKMLAFLKLLARLANAS